MRGPRGLLRTRPVVLSAQTDRRFMVFSAQAGTEGARAFIIGSSVNPIHRGAPMPTYHVEMMEGRTVEQKKKLVEAITRVSVEILGGQPEAVDILITDITRENWATGGKLWSEPRD